MAAQVRGLPQPLAGRYSACHRWVSEDPRQNTSIWPLAWPTAAGLLPRTPMFSCRSPDQLVSGVKEASCRRPFLPLANTATLPGTDATADGWVRQLAADADRAVPAAAGRVPVVPQFAVLPLEERVHVTGGLGGRLGDLR